MDEFNLSGTLKVFGAPAEEQLISRPYFVRDGHFKDVDIALHSHIGTGFKTMYGILQYALISAEFTFKGESSHAATSPWTARDALDAAVLMDVGFDKLREHLYPTQRSHRVIVEGGNQPNVIPSQTKIWWYFRESTAERVKSIFEKAKMIAKGAALMTGTEYSVKVLSAVWPTRANEVVAEVIQKNIEETGMPEWTAEEQKFAKDLQAKINLRTIGLNTEVTELKKVPVQSVSANDSGDITWVVPSGRIIFPANIPHIPFHHWSAGVALTTPIAHKGALAGAKAMASSAIDFLLDSKLVNKAKEVFKNETLGYDFKPLLPFNQNPPLDLNKELMERYRPSMQKYYINEKPDFN